MSFISDAIAATTTAATSTAAATNGSPAGQYGSLLMMLGFVLIFYFLLWRPQSKRAKEHRNLLANLTQGDEVITAGGITGKILRLTDGFIVLTIAEGVDIVLQKQAITTVLPKGTLKAI